VHPIFRNRQFLSAYLPGWIPIGMMLAFVLRVSTHLPWLEVVAVITPLTVILAVVCLTAWYVCRAFDLRTTPDWKLLLAFLPAAMCGSTLVMAFGHLIVWSLGHVFPDLPGRFHAGIPVLAGMFCLAYLLSIVLHYLILALESSQKAEILSREAELKALKAQVNPHFLFNSLNSISALTSIDPAKARQMCIALSDFLRNSLRLGERTSIALGEELVRFGEKLRLRQQVEDGCAQCDIPPLLVQPLVENAIKHGIATLAEGGEIAVSGERRENYLRVVVENPFDPDAPPAQRTGFGLVGVRNRIQARYGAAGKLEIDVQPALYRVTLLIPWANARKT
jgi:two-component system, LytTR family, sensor histidine kinase AlgZ